ncbi:MAG: hypothetical protein FWD55_03920, partial [Propionibacteriaceae bacterium]|nr:hypothetical protein [Propionibacteriaceae bacterium]
MVVTEEEFTNWIAERTRRVTDRLKESVVTPFAFVEEASRYLLDAGGKMFRPSLVFAAGGLGHPAEGRTPGSRLGTQEAENPSTPGHPAEGRTPGSRLGTQAAENPSTPGHPAEGRTPGSRLGT